MCSSWPSANSRIRRPSLRTIPASFPPFRVSSRTTTTSFRSPKPSPHSTRRPKRAASLEGSPTVMQARNQLNVARHAAVQLGQQCDLNARRFGNYHQRQRSVVAEPIDAAKRPEYESVGSRELLHDGQNRLRGSRPNDAECDHRPEHRQLHRGQQHAARLRSTCTRAASPS